MSKNIIHGSKSYKIRSISPIKNFLYEIPFTTFATFVQHQSSTTHRLPRLTGLCVKQAFHPGNTSKDNVSY